MRIHAKLTCGALVVVLLGAAAAQEGAKPAEKPAAPPEKQEQVVIPIKHVEVQRLAEVIRIFDVQVRLDPQLRVLAVRGTPQAVAAVAEAVKRLDVPAPGPPNVEVLGYLLEGSAQGEPERVPAELQSVIKQLKTVFPYQSYRVLETPLIRTRVGRPAQVGGGLSFGPPEVPKSNYSFFFLSASVTPGSGGNTIRLEALKLTFRVPVPAVGPAGPWVFQDSTISTDLDVREGQKVVVGKATAAEKGYFLVVTAKVVD